MIKSWMFKPLIGIAAEVVSSNTTYTSSFAASGSYPDTDGIQLTDSIVGSYSYSDAKWVGYNANGNSYTLEITIDLQAVYDLGYIRFHYMRDYYNGIVSPSDLIIYGSLDNSDFDSLGTFAVTTNWLDTDGARWSDNLIIEGSYRYIKFTFTIGANELTYPNVWLFLSELEVWGI